MGIKIMVAEDELRIRKLISDYLRNDGYQVVEAADGMEALEQFYANNDIALIILDVMMPKLNGWEACREIRKESKGIPIVFLTALGETSDEIHGLDIGADEYIVKPFRYELFMARIRSLLRRCGKLDEGSFCINEVQIDTTRRTVRKNDIIVEMSPKEYELLIYLLNNQNIALHREVILNAVWGYDFYGDRRTVDTHIKNIRAKLGTVGDYIKTIRGYGYKFEVTP